MWEFRFAVRVFLEFIRGFAKEVGGTGSKKDVTVARRGFVGVGFMPAFNIKQRILSELERGHKARAYMHPVSGSRNRTADGANPFVGRVRDKQIFKFEELPHAGSLF